MCSLLSTYVLVYQRLHPVLLPLATVMNGGDSNDIENRL